MIIDCHGHYTTTPPAVEAYRTQQKEILKANPNHLFEKGVIAVSDDEIRDTIETNQLKLQKRTRDRPDDFLTACQLDGTSCR